MGYYMTGEKIAEMEREAALEVYKQKDLEVLYLDEPYAELCFSKIFDFEGVKLRSVQKAGDLRINWKTEETDRYNDLKKMYKPRTKSASTRSRTRTRRTSPSSRR